MNEIIITPKSGYAILGLNFVLALITLAVLGLSVSNNTSPLLALVPFLILGTLFCAGGYFINNPNEAKALVLFGKYKGSVKQDGFFWANPFYKKMSISQRAHTLNGEKIKVNDKNGNPILISVVLVWQVQDTSKALFAVENYTTYVNSQSEAAIRSLAGRYPYDNFETDSTEEITLRTEADTVNHVLVTELTSRLERAGVEVVEARINHLAYAEEIASAMLQRQQASAVVAARKQIVAGAVGIVEMALHQLSEKAFVTLDEERKAAMVSNLLVVLTSERGTQPVINTGTLYN